MKKFIKKFSIIIFINMIFLFNYTYATTDIELKKQEEDIDKKIEETNSEIAGVKSKMTDELNQINNLNYKISSYENDISSLEKKISNLILEIDQKESNLVKEQEKYIEQQNTLNKRLIALYESGTLTFLDVLLSSESFSDFVSKYYLISQIAEYDNKLLKEIENTKNKIEEEKNILENSKLEVESSKKEIEITKNSLSYSLKEKKGIVDTLSNEESELQKQLEEFEQDKREIQQELAKIASEDSSFESPIFSSPSEYGYIFPVANCTKKNINKLIYPSYIGHTGIDVNINVIGKKVVAVKSGTVVKSKALKRSNGTYKSYGEYIVINHHDGTMTLYAHMLAGSRKVFVGDKVSQGQVIGTVGSTGNSTGPHLHFEVLIKGNPVNPIPYLP